jgi:hypothetical protein
MMICRAAQYGRSAFAALRSALVNGRFSGIGSLADVARGGFDGIIRFVNGIVAVIGIVPVVTLVGQRFPWMGTAYGMGGVRHVVFSWASKAKQAL